MKRFKFLSGDTSQEDFERLMDMLHELDHLPVVNINEIVGERRMGLLNDYHENGLDFMDYLPYEYVHANGETYRSGIATKTMREWEDLYNNDLDHYYLFYAVYYHGDEESEAHVVEMDGAINVFPSFVAAQPEEDFMFEFIQIPRL